LININLLPKHLRRVREPGYWKLVAVLFPLVVFGTLGFLQFSRIQTISNLESEVADLEARRAALQPFIERQRELQTELRNIQALLAVRDQVQADRIFWTGEISGMLETLPAQGSAARPRIDFQSLSMQAVTPPQADPNRFEGRPIIAQMNVSGNVVDTATLSEFVRALETSSTFGVDFQNAARQQDSELYTYNLTIGALQRDGGAP
jgi:type IV pilus assembly protein PilN